MNIDILDPSIKCNADRDGATLYEARAGNRTVRVLTFSQKGADALAASWQEPEKTQEETLL